MLAVLALLYLMLAMRVRIRLDVSLGRSGSIAISVFIAVLEIRLDGQIVQEAGKAFPRLDIRYGKMRRFQLHGKRQGVIRRERYPYLIAALRTGRFDQAWLQMRIGLEDAGATALAAGALRAGVLSALSLINASGASVSILPDFGGTCFLMDVRCIFSCQPGDIMTAVIKTAVKKTGKEGLGWKSIPLRA